MIFKIVGKGQITKDFGRYKIKLNRLFTTISKKKHIPVFSLKVNWLNKDENILQVKKNNLNLSLKMKRYFKN